jgi:hypothetical protein
VILVVLCYNTIIKVSHTTGYVIQNYGTTRTFFRGMGGKVRERDGIG